jgi:hypothetical protein
MIWEPKPNPDAIARALAITKPIPYTNGAWEATVQNVADALGLGMNTPERESFTATAGIPNTPDLLDNLITEGQYMPNWRGENL